MFLRNIERQCVHTHTHTHTLIHTRIYNTYMELICIPLHKDIYILAYFISSGFLRPEKIHPPQVGLNPRTVDLEASTLPRDHRGRHKVVK